MSRRPCTPIVLLVDDDADVRAAIAEALTDLGARVTQARDGVEALDALARGPLPCVALVDLNMPRMSGEEFARAVRHATWEVGLVSMSASDATLAPPLVDGHLRKPFGVDSLRALVERCCPRARAAGPSSAGGCRHG